VRRLFNSIMTYLYLGIAIVGAVLATSDLKATNEFNRPGPTAIVVTGYLYVLYFLSLPLKTISAGVAYAICRGSIVVLVAIARLQNSPTTPASQSREQIRRDDAAFCE
jgi:multidrug transporter EmrE-like cation transporter